MFDVLLHETELMAAESIIEQLKQAFKARESFSRDELLDFYRQFEPGLSESTFRWRIHNFRQKKLLRAISKNEFTFDYKPAYKPQVSDYEIKLFNFLEKEFAPIKKTVWSTQIINEFMLHMPARHFILVEAEKETTETVFHSLIDNNIKNVFLRPSEKEMQRYISENDNAVIVHSLISKAPLWPVKNKNFITIEKLLVDLFADRKTFYTYQGNELTVIFNNAFRRYAIDFTKLLSYAKRRKRKNDLIRFLSDKTDVPETILND